MKHGRKRWRYVVGIFLLLLAASHIVRWIKGPPLALYDYQTSIELRVVDGKEVLDETVIMAYTRTDPDTSLYPNPATLMLLHGSPMASRSMLPLARALPDSLRLIIPDLPGFGTSTLRIPDYSVDAHAVYLNQFLDSLQLGPVHMVAYSMSGGVALQAYDMVPENVASIIMLSAIGVQELELLGSYALNHAVHGLQLAFLWSLQELFPHFGFMDEVMLNTSYARNFYDTDQRPLRGILHAYDAPMLILHGDNDLQVPVQTATEHERIVPQSELALYEGGHGLLFWIPDGFINRIVEFVGRVEQGNAAIRATASADRIAKAGEPFDRSAIPKAEGLTLIVFILLIMMATMVSEDATCIGAGLLVAQGTLDYMPAMLASLSGIVIGDMLLFLAGRYISRPMLSRRPLRWFINPDALESASQWVQERGAAIIIASRFIPGSRLPTYVSAGSLGMPFWKFAFYFLVASILWTPMLVGVSVFFGDQLLEPFVKVYEDYAIWIFIGMMVLILSMVKIVLPMFSHEGRRTLLGAWKRKVEWEFWPMWVFYPPIVLYVVYLGIRYRSLTLFTNANPGIDLGGFVGESKAAILEGLKGSEAFIARYGVVETHEDLEQRTTTVKVFMEGAGLTYPIMLKPDVGERGTNVVKAEDEKAVATYLSRNKGRVIAQEYAPGAEFGIFYYRYPNEETGHIFSITDKQFPHVEGDGNRTLRRLILDDNRAVSMARHYFKANSERLYDVPEAGESIQLVDIGTHCRGAIFLDGQAINTPALTERIDAISKGFNGFYFGRYDIRTPDVEALKAGRGFKIVELNGVTSEATHIYDPRNSLLDAYRVLREQWYIAFEIGAQNQRLGIKPASLFEVLKRIIAR